MLLKKKSTLGEKNGVSYLNGAVKFQRVSLNVYSYLIDGVLIDTGSQSLHKYFEAFIDEADFDQVMITHFHEDHTGCAAYIEKTKKLPIYLNEKTIEYCTQRADYPLYRQRKVFLQLFIHWNKCSRMILGMSFATTKDL